MDTKDKNEEILEHTDEELDEIDAEKSGISEYCFSNPDPYAKVEPRPAGSPKRDFHFDENGNIVVKNPSAFWLPDIKIVDEIGGTEFTVTGSYAGNEPLHKKLIRIMEQQSADDKTGIMEETDET